MGTKKVVITGALGHIGSRLIRALPLLLPDCDLVLVDSLLTQRYNSLFDLPGERCRFIEGDVTSLDLEPLIAGATAVIHLAAITDTVGTRDQLSFVEANNLGGTRRVAQACAKLGVPLLMPSSTSVYGSNEALVAEDTALDEHNPQTPYALIKMREEALLAELGATQGLAFVIFRFGSIFGAAPGMRFLTAVSRFCWQAAFGQPLSVWRSAYDQTRPHLDLVDALRAIAFALQNNVFDRRIYNVATLNATPREIVAALRQFVPDLSVALVAGPFESPFSYGVSTDRLRARGFAFAGNLQRGIGETIALLRSGRADAVNRLREDARWRTLS